MNGGWRFNTIDSYQLVADFIPVTYTYHLQNNSAAPNIGQLKEVSSSAATTIYGSYNAK